MIDLTTNKREFKKRVDLQVSLLTAVITLISSLSIFAMCYYITYSDLIQMLQGRVDAIYEKVDKDLNMYTFESISEENDIKTMGYEAARILLSSLRTTTGASYIFTVKEDTNGQLIYVVDGMSMTDEEFRKPGVPLEEELQENAWKAIQGEVVLPDTMYDTSWGQFYWAFYPAEKNGEVVGAIGIAFETAEQYRTYQMLGFLTPVVCLICCIAATYISFHVFRRISNPNYKDVYNTDMLTGLKNRNAFEVDINNLNAGRNFGGRAVLSIDLNNLKKVNDNFGHAAGDRYIQSAAEILSEYAIQGSVSYRTGGDEFTVLVENAQQVQLEMWIDSLHRLMREMKIGTGEWNSFAIGYAIYNATTDVDLIDTYKRADHEMYKDKQIQKALQKKQSKLKASSHRRYDSKLSFLKIIS